MKISVCIPTYLRAELLKDCLESLSHQTHPPDEIVISDAGQDMETANIITTFADKQLNISVHHCVTERRALPWQRWWAFKHSSGDVILFIDDDVQLTPTAIYTLVDFYENHNSDLAGVGFPMIVNNTSDVAKENTIVTRWLNTEKQAPGTVTSGGLTISHRAKSPHEVSQVDWLCGGAMSFPSKVLEQIGPLEYLFQLYDQNLGKGEDAVLSYQANLYGKLYLISGDYAIHPPLETAVRTANPQNGYRKGILETWGRAHSFRWMAKTAKDWRITWLKYICVELVRSWISIFKSPATLGNWARLLGGIRGVYMITVKNIPPYPKDKSTL